MPKPAFLLKISILSYYVLIYLYIKSALRGNQKKKNYLENPIIIRNTSHQPVQLHGLEFQM